MPIEITVAILATVQRTYVPFCRLVCRRWECAVRALCGTCPPPPYVTGTLLVAYGEVELLDYALAHGMEPSSLAVSAAILGGRRTCLDRMLAWRDRRAIPAARGVGIDGGCAMAAAAGDMATLLHLRSTGSPFGRRSVQAAAFHGHLRIVRYALKRGYRIDQPLLECAFCGGNPRVARKLVRVIERDGPTERHPLRMPYRTAIRPATGGFMTAIGACIYLAAQFGHADLATETCRRYGFCYSLVASGVALSGNARLLARTFAAAGTAVRHCDRRCMAHAAIMDSAITSGNVACVKMVHELNGVLVEQDLARAAALGYRRVVNLLRVLGCPWDQRTIAFATARGHHDIVDWAVRHGCPGPDPVTMEWARVHAPKRPELPSHLGMCLDPERAMLRIRGRIRQDRGPPLPPLPWERPIPEISAVDLLADWALEASGAG